MLDSFKECPKIPILKLLLYKELAKDLKKGVSNYLLNYKLGNLFKVFDNPNF
jgi:hypothetical protein